MIIFSNVLLVNANEMEHFSGWETGATFAHIGDLIERKRNTPKVEKAMIPCDWIEKYEFYLNKDRRDINSFRYLGSLKPFASGDTVSDIRLASHSWYSWGWTWSPITSTFQVLEFEELMTIPAYILNSLNVVLYCRKIISPDLKEYFLAYSENCQNPKSPKHITHSPLSPV